MWIASAHCQKIQVVLEPHNKSLIFCEPKRRVYFKPYNKYLYIPYRLELWKPLELVPNTFYREKEVEREKDFSNGESGTILNLHTWITFFSVEHLATKYTNMFNFSSLKGQCQEDFAVLGQLCAKIITLTLYS